jgi:CRISPR-associated protein Cmr5
MTTGAEQTRTSRRRSLEQERANEAWAVVARLKDQPIAREYRSLAQSAPADIQANGLGQTLAFWRAKGYDKGQAKQDNAHARLFEDVSAWVCRQLQIGDGRDLLTWVVETATTNDYRRATAEALAFLTWLKRFVEAELPSGGER